MRADPIGSVRLADQWRLPSALCFAAVGKQPTHRRPLRVHTLIDNRFRGRRPGDAEVCTLETESAARLALVMRAPIQFAVLMAAVGDHPQWLAAYPCRSEPGLWTHRTELLDDRKSRILCFFIREKCASSKSY